MRLSGFRDEWERRNLNKPINNHYFAILQRSAYFSSIWNVWLRKVVLMFYWKSTGVRGRNQNMKKIPSSWRENLLHLSQRALARGLKWSKFSLRLDGIFWILRFLPRTPVDLLYITQIKGIQVYLLATGQKHQIKKIWHLALGQKHQIKKYGILP